MIPDAGLKRAPDSEQHMRERLEQLQPRGHGPDPLKDTYLDKTIDEIVRPLEEPIAKLKRKVDQEKVTTSQVIKIRDQIANEKGKLAPGTGPDMFKSFGLND